MTPQPEQARLDRRAQPDLRRNLVRRVPVARLDEIPQGTMLMVQVDGTNILLVNLDGTIRAHAGRLLARVLRA